MTVRLELRSVGVLDAVRVDPVFVELAVLEPVRLEVFSVSVLDPVRGISSGTTLEPVWLVALSVPELVSVLEEPV